ncbi:flagellar biosynthesis protein FlhF [Niveibacterium sp. 24ML]|uniref:flagellar biosynthesis protein FlhF n=1 Tax=Niveibacterium sp. 24ML TaxID=2985512 RepID=UPI00226E1D56|nr:flagellar biosynthesis protein FlhF [Niveibacterium sp. 24ML]MCX9157967.1 flagellar biosynthesis protein FlhF [Niveibacterium sp. 24ML]
MINVKRYYGRTARDALRLVKEELGNDAVVLSNRAVDGGVEILALPSEEVGAVQASMRAHQQPQAAAPAPAPDLRAAVPAARASQHSPQPALRPEARPEARAMAARQAPEQAADESDFRVSLSTRIARANAADAALPQGLIEGVPHAVSDPRAQIRPFMPPRVDRSGRPVEPPLERTSPPEDPWAQRAEFRAETYDDPPRPRRPQAEPTPPRRDRQIEQRAAELAARMAAESADAEKVRALEAANAKMAEEMGAIRGMIERQLAGFAWGELTRGAPVRAQIMSELLEAGFSAQLSRELTEVVPGEVSADQARTLVRSQISRRMLTLESESDLIERGGVYALVGPTGVGKTTTAAKLAARCVVRHGAERLALITTDGYRIGAHEQLRIYGRILGVQVHTVRDASELRRTLQDLAGKHMVLIDTIGMSQRDKMVAEQAAMLSGAGCVRRLLLLNSTSRGDTLEDVVRAYEGPDLAGCILTKTDEAASLAPALDVMIRHELRGYYIANGQRVPEDLHLPNRAWLTHRALRELAPDSPFRLTPEDAGLLSSAPRSNGGEGARA